MAMDFDNEIMIYDAEIINAVPGDGERLSGINYCDGWTDFAGMGISVVCAYLMRAGTTHVFMEDNIDDFALMASRCRYVAGFNSVRFDEPLLEACWGVRIPTEKSFDFKLAIIAAAGLNIKKHHSGYSLERCCGANTGGVKNGHGALAPLWWQRGKYGRVIDYCLGDVSLLVKLYQRMRACRARSSVNFKDPVTGWYLAVELLGLSK